MVRLSGEGAAFLCAHGSGVTVELEAREPLEAAWWAVAWYEATADYRLLTAAGGRNLPRAAGVDGEHYGSGPGRASGAARRNAELVSPL